MARAQNLYTVPFGPPRNYGTRQTSNPEFRQWTNHYSSSYSSFDPRNFIEMDKGEAYHKDSVWIGGPSDNDVYDHAREHVGYWTHVGGPNQHVGGDSTTNNNFMLAKIANTYDKLVYNIGHSSQVSTGWNQRACNDYCVIGASGMFKPRSDTSGNGYASFGVNKIYMFYIVGSSEGYYTDMLTALSKFLAFLQCIAATPDGDSPDVAGCYDQIQGFGSVDKDFQKRIIVDLLEQYDLNYDEKIVDPRIPNIPGLPINEIIEILQGIVDAIFDRIDEIIAQLTEYITQFTQLLGGIVQGFENLSNNLSIPEFIAELHQESQSYFPMGRIDWASEPSESARWYCGTVTPFVSRTVALLQLTPNGLLLVMGATKKQGVGSSDRRMEVYDWAPIYAPGGGRRTEPKALKVVAHYDRRKFEGFIEPRTSTHIELYGNTATSGNG
jgi:hypothetical protein